MYVSRRHTRRLLLPPGWVALGFLLLLGCQLLLAHWRQMQVTTVLQLQMPVLERVAATYPVGNIMRKFSNTLSRIKRETNWHTVYFDGDKLSQFMNDAEVAKAMSSIAADNTHARGVRIYFRPGTTYGNLVSLLDLINRLGHQRYWFDVEHQPTTFYAVNSQALRPIREEGLTPRYVPLCMSPIVGKYEPPISVPSSWQIAQQDFADLWQQPWRLSTILIATIAALNVYRLARPRPSLR